MYSGTLTSYALDLHDHDGNSPDSPDNPERVRDRRLDRKIVLKVMSWVEPFYFVAYRRTFNVLC